MVKVKVLEVDEKRKRITLTTRLTDAPANKYRRRGGSASVSSQGDRKNRPAKPQQKQSPKPATAMAAAFARLKG